MSEANVIFSLDGANLTIKCSIDDKMSDICKDYSTKIKKIYILFYFCMKEVKLILN